MKKLLVLLLTSALILVFSATAFANETTPNALNNEIASTLEDNVKPTKGIAPKNNFKDEPLGLLNKEEIDKIKADDRKLNGQMSPFHFSFISHIHYFDNIYSSYDGFYDRGEVASATNGKSSIDTLSFAISRTVANKFQVNLGFDVSKVKVGVGYDVTFSEQRTWTYAAQVTPYKTVHVGYQDWYHVQEFNIHNVYYNNFGNETDTEYGTGYASQWFKPHFYSWET